MIVTLAGGVGGARMAAGLAQVIEPDQLTVIVNTADDFEHLGLAISPDLDTVMYTLAGLENPLEGWGRRDETWSFMATLSELGGETWFQLGDRDLAVHVERTRLMADGLGLSRVTRQLSVKLGVSVSIVPMSDDRVRTMVMTDAGRLPFQHYFVRERCEPIALGFSFEGAGTARAADGAIAALHDRALEAIVVAPSNPFVSVAPILAIGELRAAIADRSVPLVAVSPIVSGRAVKGPAAKMMAEQGLEPSALGIAMHYGRLLDGLVIDIADGSHAESIENLGISVHVTNTMMVDEATRRQLAGDTIQFARWLGRRNGGVPA